MQKYYSIKPKFSGFASAVSVLVLACALTVAVPITFPMETSSVALAQQSGNGGGEGVGGQGGGGQADGGQGSGGGSGKGGPSADSDGKGPRAGSSGDSTGGKPVWAQEGIPSYIELGRLSVACAPDRILEKAVAEELSNLTQAEIDFYSLSFEDMKEALATDFDNVAMIDSPVANLGLLMDVLGAGTNQVSELEAAGVTNPADEDRTLSEKLAAVFLGTASDKTIEITTATADAVATILGYDLTDDQAEALGADAEAIREAILEGHG